MLSTTADAIRSMLKADPSLSPDDRNAILHAVRNHGKINTPRSEPIPQLVSRRRAAAMLGRSTRLVDLLANSGRLARVRLTGATRAAGFRYSDVVALINGGAAAAQGEAQ
jgi:hypothetical protein